MKIFGSTIQETVEAFSPSHLGKPKVRKSDKKKDRTLSIGRLIISIMLIFLATYLLVNFDNGTEKIGSTIIGAIIGYWLK